MAGQDMRRLAILVPRCLSHRNFPAQAVLAPGSVQSTEYYVFPAVCEATLLLARRNEYVANLLCMEHDPGGPGYALPYRLLSMIGVGEVILRNRLLNILASLGFDKGAVRKCLKILADANLIRGHDSEKWHLPAPPLRLQITANGMFYAHQLMRDPDYLAAMVPDVPLPHLMFRKELQSVGFGFSRQAHRAVADDFANRLGSLSEYAMEVEAAEGNEISRLELIDPARRAAIAEMLLSAGFLTSKLAHALKEVADRGRRSASPAVRDRSSELGRQANSLNDKATEWVLALRDWRFSSAPTPEFVEPLPIEAAGVTGELVRGVDPSNRGRAQVETTDEFDALALSVIRRKDGAVAASTVLRERTPRSDGRARRFEGNIALPDDIVGQASAVVKVVAIDHRNRRLLTKQTAIVFPAAEPNDGLSLGIFTSGDGWDSCGRQAAVDQQVAKNLAAEVKRNVAISLMQGELIHQSVRRHGMSLARRFLAGAVPERFLCAYTTIGSTIVLPGLEWLPLEWIAPPATDQGSHELLSVQTEVIRVPLADIQPRGVGLSLERNPPAIGVLELCSIDDGASKSINELLIQSQQADCLHLIGHAESNGIRLSSDFILDLNIVLAFPLSARVRSIIVSACSNNPDGSTSCALEIATQLAALGRRDVWVSMVDLRLHDAKDLHRSLQAFSPRTPMYQAMASLRAAAQSNPALLYARYAASVRQRGDE